MTSIYFLLALKQTFIIHINEKYHRNKLKNRTSYFFNDMINNEDFKSKFIKNRQEFIQKH